jgi:hypothetical protein
VVAVVVIGVVRFASILSPFPLEDTEGRSLFASVPINLQRAHFHPCQASGWAVEGWDLESSVCTCVCGHPVCVCLH